MYECRKALICLVDIAGGWKQRWAFPIEFRFSDTCRTKKELSEYQTNKAIVLQPKLWIEKTNDLVHIETEISRNLKGLVAIEIATAVRKKSLATVAIAIWYFETQPRRERELDR